MSTRRTAKPDAPESEPTSQEIDGGSVMTAPAEEPGSLTASAAAQIAAEHALRLQAPLTWTIPDDEQDLAKHLAARFTSVQKDSRGQMTFEYVTGGQVTQRLNDVLGPLGWEFAILAHGEDHKEYWVRGRLTVYRPDGTPISKEQFGSQKLKVIRSTGEPLDIGFDLKGAATDALKKCASLFGVGLYFSKNTDAGELEESALSSVQGRVEATQHPAPGAQAQQRPAQGQSGASPAAAPNGAAGTNGSPAFPLCSVCQAPLKAIDVRGERWTPARLAQQTKAKYGRVLCPGHVRQAAQEAAAHAAQQENLDDAFGGEDADPSPARNGVAPDTWRLGSFDPRVLAVLHGQNRYAGPYNEQVKRGFYIQCSKSLSYSREDIYKLLGLLPKTQHLEDWLTVADVNLDALYNLIMQHSLDDTLQIPSAAALTLVKTGEVT
jgi:hypothetical protein